MTKKRTRAGIKKEHTSNFRLSKSFPESLDSMEKQPFGITTTISAWKNVKDKLSA